MNRARARVSSSRRHAGPLKYLLALAPIAVFLILAHGPLLTLPYFWDEAGQFVPAALDLYHAGALVPFSTLPNVHPPGVMAWLALVWRVFGYSIVATRVAMLAVAALGALATFLLGIELARGTRGMPAFTVLAFLCASPLFFSQAMMAQLDMPAMAFWTLGLLLFLQNRFVASAAVCVVLVLVKETGLVAPAMFGLWLLGERRYRQSLWFVLPGVALGLWLLLLHARTGSWFGNAAFAAYNLRYPLQPGRLLLAVLRRFYYLFIGSGHIAGSAVLALGLWRSATLRIAMTTRAWRVTGALSGIYTVAMCVTGGAVLERYLLPVLPVLYAAFGLAFETLEARARAVVMVGLLGCLGVASFVNPLYSFPLENNLAFVSFVRLEQQAAAAVELREGAKPRVVVTAFPLSDALRNRELGFASLDETKMRVLGVEGFDRETIGKLKTRAPDLLVSFDTSWDPLGMMRRRWFRELMEKQFGYVPQMTAEEIAGVLSMRVSQRWSERGFRMTLLEKAP